MENVSSDTEVADRQAEPIEPGFRKRSCGFAGQKADATKQTEQSGNHATMNLPESRPVEKRTSKILKIWKKVQNQEILQPVKQEKRSLYACKMKAIQS